MSGKSPTQLTLERLRADGYTAEVVEKWVPGANIKRDLWGFVDIVALRGTETLAVQCTTSANLAARVTKIADSPLVGTVREAGWTIHAHGWLKRNGRWVVRVVDCS